MAATVAAIIIVALVLLGVGGVLLWKWKHTPNPDWKPIPGVYGATYVAPPDVPAAAISRCLQYAIAMLGEHTDWPRHVIAEAVERLSIVVTQHVDWQDGYGQKVGGSTVGYAVAVDHGMASLLHELAHVVEFHTMGDYDREHAGWSEKGIDRADAAYRAWLG